MLLGSFFGGINNKSQITNTNLQINNNSQSQNPKKPKNNILNRIRLKVMELRYLPHLEIRLVHDKVYSKGGKYKKWTDNPKSKDVHRTTAYAFFFSFVVFTLAQSLFPIFDLGRPDRAFAAQNSVTWTDRAHFENNNAPNSNFTGPTTRTNIDTASSPGDTRLGFGLQPGPNATISPTPSNISAGGDLVSTRNDFLYGFQGGTTAFFRFSISQNTWTTMAPAPANIDNGGDLAYPGTGDFIYGFQGGTTAFFRYSISQNAWTTMAPAPGVTGDGAALTATGNDFIYAFRGASATAFWRYSISGNSWVAMTSTPMGISGAGGLTYPGSGDFIYALQGWGIAAGSLYIYSISGNSWGQTTTPEINRSGGDLVSTGGDFVYVTMGGFPTFWRYSTSLGTWSTMMSLPSSISSGAALVYPGSGDFIYATGGNNTTNFFRYSISQNLWQTISPPPAAINTGGALVYPGSGDFIYGFRGGFTTGFSRYSISGNSWTAMAPAPVGINQGGALVYPGSGDFIYAYQGNETTTFLRYSISTNTWATMASTPAVIGNGGALVYPGSGDFIYGFQRHGSSAFFRYSISANTWTTMAAAPNSVSNGAALVYPGAGDFIYGLVGGGMTAFIRYSISANTWTTMAAAPGFVSTGGALASPGGNFIYAFQGGGNAAFWRYSISANTWTWMTSTPAAINAGGALVASGGDFIYAFQGNNTFGFFAYSISGNQWLVGTRNVFLSPGTITNLKINSGEGVRSRWSTISWQGVTPTNTSITFRTRGANTEAGLTTATWSQPYTTSGSAITTPSSQWLEIELRLTSTDGINTPTLNDFTVTYDTLEAPQNTNTSILRTDGTSLKNSTGANVSAGGVGAWTNQNTVRITANNLTCTACSGNLAGRRIQVQHNPVGTAFANETTNLFSGNSVGDPNGAVSSTVDITGLTPGNYHFRMRVVDDAGRASGWVSYGGNTDITGTDFSVDTAVPTITSSLINNNAQATNQNTVTLNITAQDTGGSNLSMMRFSNDNTTWSTWENFNSVKTGWTLTAGDGTKTVFTQVQDNAGNVSTTASDNIFFDTTPPTVLSNTITSPNGGEFWSGGTHRDITWNTNSVTDATSGLRGTNGNQAITLFYSDDNRSTWNLISENLNNGNNGCTNPTSGCFRWLLPNVQSEHVWIRITATDNAGNQSFAPGHFDTSDARFTLEADTNAPEFPEYTPSVSPHHLREGINYTSGNTTLAWSLPTDRGSGVTNFSLWVRQVGVDTNFRLLNSLTLDQTSKVLTLSEGAWEWRLRAIDVVGLTTDSPIYQVTVDTTAPSGTLRLFPNLNNGITATRSSNVHLDVTNINDTASGYHEVSFSNSATGPWSAFQEETNFTNWDLSNMLLGGNNNQGTKTVFIRLRDRVGNTSSVVSGSIVWDSTTPLHPGNLRLTNTVNQRSTFVDNAWRGTSTTRLNWDAAVDPANPVASGVHQYLVYRAKESNNPNNATLLGVTTNLFWNDTNLLDSRTYHYWVQVVDMAQNSSDHTLSTPALLLLSDITPPETPRNFVASGLNDSVVRIDFRAAPDNSLVFDGVAQRYRIFRAGPFLTEPLGDPTTYNYDLYLAELPFKEDGNYRLDDDVTPERWYYYRLIAFDAAGLESNPIFHRARGNFAQVFNQEDITLSVNNQRTPETVRPGDTLTINFKVTDQDGRVDLDTGNAAQRVRIVNGLGNEVLPFTSVTQKTDHENGGHLGYSYTFTYLIPENASYGTYTTSIHVATSVATGNPGSNPHNQLRMVNFRVPPQSPTALSAVGHTSSAVRLSWVAPGNSNNQQGLRTTQTYKVERREDAGNFVLAGHTTQTNFTDTGLTIDTEYTYRVRAYDISQNPGSWSLEVSARTPKPNTPTSASVQEASHNNILMGGSFPVRYLVSWDAVWRGEEAGQVPDLRGYKVFRATNLIWDPNPIAEIDILRAGFNQTYFLDVHPASLENAIFQYRIKPWDEAGNLGDYVETPRTTATEVPQLVSQPTVTETGVSWVKLRWMSNQPSYGVVQYKKASEARYRSLAGDPEVTTTKDGNNYVHIITVDGLEKGTVYNFRVQSVNVANVISTFSNEITASTRPFNISDIQRRITASSATISWRTVGVSSQGLVEYRRGNAETKVLGTGRDAEDHSVSLSALSPGDYVFTLRNIDSEGNIATSGLESFTITGFDEGAISSPQAGQIEEKNITATSARITWRSTVPTTSWIDYGTNSGRYTSSTGSDSLTTNHIVTLEGLTPGTTYFYRVRGIDANGIEYISREYSFTAVLQPEISNIRLNLVSPYIAEVTFDTNVDTEASITFGKDNNLDLKAGNTELRRGHLIRLENLEDGANYSFLVEVRDALGNLVRSEPQPFSTPIDKAGPKVQNIKIDILPMGEADETASVIISWNTNKPSTTKVEYDAGVIGTNLTKSTVEDTALNTSHTVVIRDLEPATTYRFKIAGVDRRDNPTESSTYTFVTPARERSILQLIIRSLEETFAWTRNVGSFFNNVWNRD